MTAEGRAQTVVLRCPDLSCPWVYRPGVDDPAIVHEHLATHREGREQTCPFCGHGLDHHDQPDCWDCTNAGTVCDSESATAREQASDA